MSDQSRDTDEDAGHGVSGTQRGDSRMEEEPENPPEADMETWAEQTQTGGQATD